MKCPASGPSLLKGGQHEPLYTVFTEIGTICNIQHIQQHGRHCINKQKLLFHCNKKIMGEIQNNICQAFLTKYSKVILGFSLWNKLWHIVCKIRLMSHSLLATIWWKWSYDKWMIWYKDGKCPMQQVHRVPCTYMV